MAAVAKATLIAVDKNYLLDLAAETPVSWDALETISERLPGPIILVWPTVIDELSVSFDGSADP
jgi:hypothetical protein